MTSGWSWPLKSAAAQPQAVLRLCRNNTLIQIRTLPRRGLEIQPLCCARIPRIFVGPSLPGRQLGFACRRDKIIQKVFQTATAEPYWHGTVVLRVRQKPVGRLSADIATTCGKSCNWSGTCLGGRVQEAEDWGTSPSVSEQDRRPIARREGLRIPV